MYKIFRENRERVPYNKIKKLYKDKWVFLVNLEGIEFIYDEELGGMTYSEPISAEIFIVSDFPYEGFDKNVSEELRNNRKKYGNISEMDCRSGNILPKNYYNSDGT
jgi:hypothetical protein